MSATTRYGAPSFRQPDVTRAPPTGLRQEDLPWNPVREVAKTEGGVIPVLFGTKRIKKPTVLWYGDFGMMAKDRQSSQPVFGDSLVNLISLATSAGSGVKQVTCGFHFAYCYGPVDVVSEIKIGEISILSAPSTGGRVYVDKLNDPNDIKKGGTTGNIDIIVGDRATSYNNYMRLIQSYSGSHPNYHGIFSIVAEGVTIGNVAKKPEETDLEVKPWEVVVTRIMKQSDESAQWYPLKAQIGDDMNPVHIIRELFTSRHYGAGYSADLIDDDLFEAAADIAHDEGIGLSYLVEKKSTIETLLQNIEDTIRARTYVNRKTGKISIKMIRDDYIVGSLVSLDGSRISSIDRIERDISEMPNTLRVKYYDSAAEKESTVTVSEPSLVLVQGTTIAADVDIMGVTTSANALKVASSVMRDIVANKFLAKIKCNDEAADIDIGDVFIADDPERGLDSAVLRCIDINVGNYRDRSVVITAEEESASPFDTIFTPPAVTEWVRVANDPAFSPCTLIDFMPNWILRRFLTESDADRLYTDKGMVMFCGASPSTDSIHATVEIDGVTMPEVVTHAVHALLPEAMTKQTYWLHIPDLIGKVAVGDALQIAGVNNTTRMNNTTTGDFEIVGVHAIDEETEEIGLLRGCMDTVPRIHEIGEHIIHLGYVQSDFNGVTYQVPAPGAFTVNMIYQPHTIKGKLLVGNGDGVNPLEKSRHRKPLPPCNLVINLGYWPEAVSGILDISWLHRNREVVDQLYGHYATLSPGHDKEQGVTYDVTVAGFNGGTQEGLWSDTGIDGFGVFVPALNKTWGDLGPYEGEIIISVWSRQEDHGQSHFTLTHRCDYTQ